MKMRARSSAARQRVLKIRTAFRQSARGLQLRFVDGVDDEPRDVCRYEPVSELCGSADLKSLIEITVDLFDPDEDGVVTTRLDPPRTSLRLECLSGAWLGNHEDTIRLLNLMPSLRLAAPWHEEIPFRRPGRWV